MLNTLYTIAGGIALAVGALGASDDFDGAQLAQNAFFGPEDELETIDEQETATEEIQVANDIDEWNEITDETLNVSLTDDNAVLKEIIPADASDNPEETSQLATEELSGNEFYRILERQYEDAMTALSFEEEQEIAPEDNPEVAPEEESEVATEDDPEEAIEDSDPLIIGAGTESKQNADADDFDFETTEEITYDDSNDLTADVELQPEDDVNAEKALEEAYSSSVIEEKPWLFTDGDRLPDIPEEDMNRLMNQTPNNEQPEKNELLENETINVQEIPVIESDFLDVPEVDVPELDIIAPPLFDEAEDVEEAKEAETADDVEVETTENVEAEAEEAEAEVVETDEAETEEV